MIHKLVIVLLLLHGIAATYCGYAMMDDPSGKAIGLSQGLLQHSPFDDYFVPGLILCIVLGLGCIFTGITAVIRSKYHTKLIILTGGSIVIWILVQIVMIQTFFFMQFIIGAIGLIISVCGILLDMQEKKLVK